MITHFQTSKHYWQPEIAAKGCVTKFKKKKIFVGKSDREGGGVN